jgi:hypothetical protein
VTSKFPSDAALATSEFMVPVTFTPKLHSLDAEVTVGDREQFRRTQVERDHATGPVRVDDR